MVGGDRHQIDSLQVSGTPDFDHGVCHREDLFDHKKDLVNDGKDLYSNRKDLFEG